MLLEMFVMKRLFVMLPFRHRYIQTNLPPMYKPPGYRIYGSNTRNAKHRALYHSLIRSDPCPNR